jgi:hypothetical protein
MPSTEQQAMLMESQDGTSYVTYGSETRASKSRSGLILGICAIGVAAVALGLAASAHVTSANVASQDTQLQTVVQTQAAQQTTAQKSQFKSQFAGMMLMNQPACRQTHQGYVACLDLVNTASQLITDLTDPDVSIDQVLDNIRNETYNIGSAVAFATMQNDRVEAMAPRLAEALDDPSNRLTVNGVADLSKCDYVWRGVACLTLIESVHTASCEKENATKPCYRKMVPIIHILDEATEVDEFGNVRRRGAMQVVGAVAGGIAGAAGGAAAGIAVGTAVPGVGNIVGGVVGGVAGGVTGAMNGWNTGSNMQSWK